MVRAGRGATLRDWAIYRQFSDFSFVGTPRNIRKKTQNVRIMSQILRMKGPLFANEAFIDENSGPAAAVPFIFVNRHKVRSGRGKYEILAAN